MKRLFLFFQILLLLLIAGTSSPAQTLEETPGLRPKMGNFGAPTSSLAGVSCQPDTVAYPSGKATALRFLSVNTTSSGQSLYQYYDCPQSLTVSGFDFFGFASSSPGPISIACELYLASPDSLPLGQPLASDTVLVDSTLGGGTLDEIRYSATFSTPLVLNEPYILVLTNPNSSADNLSLVCNDWDLFNGGFEWLSGADFRNQPGGSWTRGYDVNVGSVPFNADVLLHPHVEYELTPLFSVDKTCFTAPDSVNFRNFSSPSVDSRMYNTLVFSNTGTQYSWNFGDGTGPVNAVNTGHAYAIPGPFNAVLTASVFGWASICTSNYGITLGTSSSPANAAFTTTQVGAYVYLTDASSGSSGVTYDFGDGSATTTLPNPDHLYTSNGTFLITQTATGSCGNGVFTDTVVVNCDFPVASFSWANTGFLVNFTDASQFATGWEWIFGDGMGFSTQQNPNYVYANFGGYEVLQIVSSDCGVDTLRDSVFIVNPNALTVEYGPEYLALYPNPASGLFHLSGSLPGHEPLALSLIGLEGRTLRQWTTAPLKEVDISLDLTDLPPGWYLLQIEGKAGRSVRKLGILR